ncbi:spore germination protein GerPB [Bacillaceae bacterium IKA-2]|nr:spore germination protein GerPB [Bacillaceae bacterium IKA-2]
MNFYINQTININTLKVGGVTNSSVLQIGSAGMIKALSNLYNTGDFVEPSPVAVDPIAPIPLVPLASPAPAAPPAPPR